MILGSGRSGTTWVLDCLANANELRPIFEPLHPQESPIAARYAYEVLASGDENEVLKRYFLDLAAGHIRSRWIDYRAPQNLYRPTLSRLLSDPGYAKRWLRRWPGYLESRRVLRDAVRRKSTLIKCIRGNLMAGWLARTVGFRTALIVRHPCAVVESQYRLQWGALWDPKPVLARYRANDRLDELTGGRYRPLLSAELTMLQALTLNWVIENQWPVERSGRDGFAVTYYEDLASSREGSWASLCAALGLPGIPDQAQLSKPSQQASGEAGQPADGRREPRWRAKFTSEQLHEIQGVLDAMDCRLYSVDQVLPLHNRF
jgi:hypothetical protein